MSDTEEPRRVSKEDFKAHIQNWPRKLKVDVYGAFDPPLVTYNDFTYGDWPASVVASHSGEFAGEPEGNWKIHREMP